MNLRRLDTLIARGNTLLAARRNPSDERNSLGDFGDAYHAWNTAGKDLILRLSGPAAAAEWSARRLRAMYALDQDGAACVKEQERQQAMLAELRALCAARAEGITSKPVKNPRRKAKRPPPAHGESAGAEAAAAHPSAAERGRVLLQRDNRELTNEEVLADLQGVAKGLGKMTITYDEYRRHGKCSTTIFKGRFGSWNKALEAAGLEVGVRKGVPAEELLANLARVWERLGRQPGWKDMAKPQSAFSAQPYLRCFGGWRNALRAFAKWANGGEIPGETARASFAAPVRRSGPPSLRLRFAVFQRDRFKCVACGRSPATHPAVELQADHIIPRSKHGQTVLENLRTLCKECNLGRGNMDPL